MNEQTDVTVTVEVNGKTLTDTTPAAEVKERGLLGSLINAATRINAQMKDAARIEELKKLTAPKGP